MAMKVETFGPSVGLHNAMPRCIGFGCKAVDKMGDYLNSFAQFVWISVITLICFLNLFEYVEGTLLMSLKTWFKSIVWFYVQRQILTFMYAYIIKMRRLNSRAYGICYRGAFHEELESITNILHQIRCID